MHPSAPVCFCRYALKSESWVIQVLKANYNEWPGMTLIQLSPAKAIAQCCGEDVWHAKLSSKREFLLRWFMMHFRDYVSVCQQATNDRWEVPQLSFLGESSECEISLLRLKSCGAKELSLDLELVLRLYLEGRLANLETLEPLVPYIWTDVFLTGKRGKGRCVML